MNPRPLEVPEHGRAWFSTMIDHGLNTVFVREVGPTVVGAETGSV